MREVIHEKFQKIQETYLDNGTGCAHAQRDVVTWLPFALCDPV